MPKLSSTLPKTINSARVTLELLQGREEQYDFIISMFHDKSFLEEVGDRGIRTARDFDAAVRNRRLASSAFKLAEPVDVDSDIVYIAKSTVDAGNPNIGIVTAHQRGSSVPPDIGWAIKTEFAGRGFASEAAKAVLDEITSGTVGIHGMIVLTDPKHKASQRIAEKIGFKYDGEATSDKGEKEAVFVLPGTKSPAGTVIDMSTDMS